MIRLRRNLWSVRDHLGNKSECEDIHAQKWVSKPSSDLGIKYPIVTDKEIFSHSKSETKQVKCKQGRTKEFNLSRNEWLVHSKQFHNQTIHLTTRE